MPTIAHVLLFVIVALLLYGERATKVVVVRIKELKRKQRLNATLKLKEWELN